MRKAKSEAQRPMRAPVSARGRARHAPSGCSALELGEGDLLEAGTIERIETAEAEEFAVEVELAEEATGEQCIT